MRASVRLLSRSCMLLGLLALATPAGAHHGWSGYDAGKEMTLTGTIREAGYEHPHGYIRLESGGKTWVVVLAPPTRMENRGLPRAELRRYVEQVRALCRGETVQGERAAMRLAFGTPERCPPVVIPAAGPKMLRLAGEVADGVILQSCPPFPGEVFQTMLGHVREGRAAAGREHERFTVYHGLPAAVHRDRAVALPPVNATTSPAPR